MYYFLVFNNNSAFHFLDLQDDDLPMEPNTSFYLHWHFQHVWLNDSYVRTK